MSIITYFVRLMYQIGAAWRRSTDAGSKVFMALGSKQIRFWKGYKSGTAMRVVVAGFILLHRFRPYAGFMFYCLTNKA